MEQGMFANTRRFTRAAFVILGALCLVPAADARKIKQQPPAPPPPPERVTSVEGITEYRLANGLRVLMFPDPSKQTITVNITYLVGSRHENYGETGMAHLLEHMLFKGSARHPDIPTELSAHGARPNGTTSWDRTNYYETFNATEENLRWALDLEADRMVNSFVAKKDLDSEMTVVRNEYEIGENNPLQVLFKRLMAAAYEWHNYGNSPIGARSDLEGVPIERLQAFYKTYYQPDNAVLVVAGKIDESKTLALVQEYFGSIPRPTRTLPTFYTAEPVQDGERLVTLRRTGDVQMAVISYHMPAGSHEDMAALQLLSEVLGNAPAGRMHKALVESGKAAAVLNYGVQNRDPGMILFGAQVRAGQPLDPVLAGLIEIAEKPAARPVTDEEVERARTQLLADIDRNLNSSERVGLMLSDWMGMGDWRLMFLHRDRLRAAKTADVQRVWAHYLRTSNRTAGLFIPTATPERAEVPATPDVVALVKDYKGDAAKEVGEEFDPSIANIESRVQRRKLPDGLELALLPKKTRGGSVFAGLALRFGDVKSLANLGDVPSATVAMLMRGSKKHTRQQISDELDRLKASVNLNTWGSGMYVSIETTRDNLPAVVALVAEILREPAFDARELEELRAERLAGVEQQRSEPTAIASVALQKLLKPYPKGDIRYVNSVDESVADIRAVTREQVQRFHREFFGAQPAQFSAVGDFDAAALEAQLQQLFGGWKAPRPFTPVPAEFHAVAPQQRVFETPDKAQAFYVTGTTLDMRDDHPDYAALAFGNYMLGGGFLNSRLMNRIRIKDGLSYGVGSQLAVDSVDRFGTFLAYALYAPQNLAKLEQAFKEEFERALKDGFTAEEIEQAKSGFSQSRTVARAQDNALMTTLGHYLYLGRTLAWDAELEKKVMALDNEQIRTALNRHIDPAKFVIMKAGDFKGAAGDATKN
jgi:zinc protease